MKWLLNDWYQLLNPPWSYFAVMISALLCGIMIGTERERKVKPAGLRTMILIASGSALFTVISSLMADASGDKGRIAAQIVTGIGFLGAGVIMHDSVRIRGLTTAAMIWVMAAIGMLCGAGYGGGAILFTATLSLFLYLVAQVENRYLGPCYQTQVTLVFDDTGGKAGIKIDGILEDYKIMKSSIHKTVSENSLTEMTLSYCNAHKYHKAFLIQFAEMAEIKSIKRID